MEAAEKPDCSEPCIGHSRTASALSSRGQFHKRLFCLSVHGIHHVPGVAVSHLHRSSGSGDRTVFTDAFKQDRPSAAEEDAFRPVDPDSAAETRPGPEIFSLSALPLHGRNIS